MVFAYDFPLLPTLLLLVFAFFWIAWILIVFRTVVDIIRSNDLSGVTKAFWLLFVAIIPWLGVLAYFFARGDKMAARAADDAQQREDAFRSYVRNAAGSGSSPASELATLADLRDRGALTEGEFQAQKAKLLA